MIEIFKIVSPVFLLISAGYVAGYRRAFTLVQANALMRFATQFAVPCLLFIAVARLDLASAFKVNILIPFYIGASMSFVITGICAFYVFRHKPGQCVAIGFSALFSNSVLIGIAIIELAYNSSALEIAFAIVAIHAPFCYVLGIISMEFCRADGLSFQKTILVATKQILSNALTQGLILGFIVNLSGLQLPIPIITTIELMAKAALPAALFGLGAILVTYKMSSHFGEVSVITLNKLILHPTVAFLMGHYVFNLSPDILRVVVVMAAMPPGINAYVFANMYQRSEHIAASAVLFATAVSIVSISIWLALIS